MNKKRLIVIIAAVIVIAAAAIVLILGLRKGWFRAKKPSDAEKETSVSLIYDDSNKIVTKEEVYEKGGDLLYTIEKSYSDQEGKILSEERYVKPDNTVEKRVVYESNGQSVQMEEYYDAKGNVDHKVEMLYADTEGKVLEQKRYFNKDNAIQKAVTYDAEGKITGVDEYKNSQVVAHYNYSAGKPDGTYSKFTFTDDNKPLGSFDYDANDKIVKKIERVYDDKGNITLYHETDGDGKTLSKTVYKYNKDGQEEKTVFYNSEGITGYVVYTYDNSGRKARMDQYENDVITKYIIFKYDKDGNATAEEHFPDQEKTTKAN